MNIWHYIVAFMTLTTLGAAIHIFRSSFNFIPDRFNLAPGHFWRNHAIDDMLSTNYGFWDMVAGTEYDEDGFYEFFSRRNLRICCTWTIAVGMTLLLSYQDLQDRFIAIVDAAPGWLWALFVYRIENLTLF